MGESQYTFALHKLGLYAIIALIIGVIWYFFIKSKENNPSNITFDLDEDKEIFNNKNKKKTK